MGVGKSPTRVAVLHSGTQDTILALDPALLVKVSENPLTSPILLHLWNEVVGLDD